MIRSQASAIETLTPELSADAFQPSVSFASAEACRPTRGAVPLLAIYGRSAVASVRKFLTCRRSLIEVIVRQCISEPEHAIAVALDDLRQVDSRVTDALIGFDSILPLEESLGARNIDLTGAFTRVMPFLNQPSCRGSGSSVARHHGTVPRGRATSRAWPRARPPCGAALRRARAPAA